MDFEDIQNLWNNQNDENLFAINQDALYATIRRKSKNIRRLVELLEWVMIGVNLVVGLSLLSDLFQDDTPGYPWLIPAVYLAFSLFALIRRLRRRQQETHFTPTLLGELDKALSQLDYLIRQGRTITLWYVLPLGLVLGIAALFNPKLWPVFALFLFILPASYFGTRWEINKWYLPKQRALEALRAQLLAPEK
jgi:hypothetical protein